MKQKLLFDQPPDMVLKGEGQRRTRIGQVIEELTCKLFGWDHCGRGSEAFVPDAYTRAQKLPCEIKSAKCGPTFKGRSILYDWRLDKEQQHAPGLAYAFLLHHTKGSPHKTIGSFLDALAARNQMALLVPAFLVREWALATAPLKKHKSSQKDGARYGYTRAGYADGYRELALEPLINAANYAGTTTLLMWQREFTFVILYHPVNAWQHRTDELITTYGPRQ